MSVCVWASSTDKCGVGQANEPTILLLSFSSAVIRGLLIAHLAFYIIHIILKLLIIPSTKQMRCK